MEIAKLWTRSLDMTFLAVWSVDRPLGHPKARKEYLQMPSQGSTCNGCFVRATLGDERREPVATTEENKRLALDTWEALRRGDVKSAFANMRDDVTWRIPGVLPPVSGLKRG